VADLDRAIAFYTEALGFTLKSRHGLGVAGKADHGVSEAIYLKDPDGNGVEIHRDRPEADWPRHPDGTPAGLNGPLDLENLLAEA
jgi:catechol 2,3-dioxygenase